MHYSHRHDLALRALAGDRDSFLSYIKLSYDKFYLLCWYMTGSVSVTEQILLYIYRNYIHLIKTVPNSVPLDIWEYQFLFNQLKVSIKTTPINHDKIWKNSFLNKTSWDLRSVLILSFIESYDIEKTALVLGMDKTLLNKIFKDIHEKYAHSNFPNVTKKSKNIKEKSLREALIEFDASFHEDDLNHSPSNLNSNHIIPSSKDSENISSRGKSDERNERLAQSVNHQSKKSHLQKDIKVSAVILAEKDPLQKIPNFKFGSKKLKDIQVKATTNKDKESFFSENRRILSFILSIIMVFIVGHLYKTQKKFAKIEYNKDLNFSKNTTPISQEEAYPSSSYAKQLYATTLPSSYNKNTTTPHIPKREEDTTPIPLNKSDIAKTNDSIKQSKDSDILSPLKPSQTVNEIRNIEEQRTIPALPSHSTENNIPQSAHRKPYQKDISKSDEPDTALPFSSKKKQTKIAPSSNNRSLIAEQNFEASIPLEVGSQSYKSSRKSLSQKKLPSPDQIKIEEFVNNFSYKYPYSEGVKGSSIFHTYFSVFPSPWNQNKYIFHIGIQGYKKNNNQKIQLPSNLVFLINLSNTKGDKSYLELIKKSLYRFINHLKPNDIVTLLVFDNSTETVLPPTFLTERNKILSSIQSLNLVSPQRSAREGLTEAYRQAQKYFSLNKINKIFLISRHDFQFGIPYSETVKATIHKGKENNIFLSILKIGSEDKGDQAFNDSLAQLGNGSSVMVETIPDALQFLVEEARNNQGIIAQNVNMSVSFNSAFVKKYRLLGWDLNDSDHFQEMSREAISLNSSYEMTAFYEIELTENALDQWIPASPDIKNENALSYYDLAQLKLNYRIPKTNLWAHQNIFVRKSSLSETLSSLPDDVRFALAVASFAQYLKQDGSVGALTLQQILSLAENSKGSDPFGKREEFIKLVRTTFETQGK